MTKTRAARWVKGTCVAAVAGAGCFWLWSSLLEWAHGVGTAHDDAMFAGFTERLIASIAGVTSMPVVLWGGMRTMGERGTLPLVAGGTVAWFIIGGHVVEDPVGAVGTWLYLALFTILSGLLSCVTRSES